jgi:hypothetical protein
LLALPFRSFSQVEARYWLDRLRREAVGINDIINAVTNLENAASDLQTAIESMPVGLARTALEDARRSLLATAGGLRKYLFDGTTGTGTWPAPTGAPGPGINQDLQLPTDLGTPSWGTVALEGVLALLILVLGYISVGRPLLPLRKTGGSDAVILSFTFYRQGGKCFVVNWWQRISRDEYPKYRVFVAVDEVPCSKVPSSPPTRLWGPL